MIILDTHAWLWWNNESSNLSNSARTAIDLTDAIGISAMSCWEVAMLAGKSRIELSMDVEAWINLALEHPKVRLLPLTPQIAVLSTRLPGNFHGDPGDRLIVATALNHKVPLISKDRKIQEWGYLQVIW